MIYLDHAATTPLDPRVLEAMLPHLKNTWGNPSSPHAKGREARAAVDSSRETMAGLLGVLSHEVVFVSSGSEGNSLALFGTCEEWLVRHGKPGHIVTASVEHSCSLKSADKLEAQGWRVTRLPADRYGMVQPGDLAGALGPETALVSIQWANNEVGTVQPVAEMQEICAEAQVPFHCDAVQGVGLLPLPSPLPDMVTIAAHKFHGPKGIGALIVRNEARLRPQVMGGGQEFGLRAGTEDTPAIVGMAKALELALENREESTLHIRRLRDSFVESVLTVEGTSVNGHPEERLPNFASIHCGGRSAESIVIQMDLAGICISSGAACVTGAVEASHVLRAMGRSPADARGSIRVSFGRTNTQKEAEQAAATLKQILKKK